MGNEIKYLVTENKSLIVSLDKSNEQITELKSKVKELEQKIEPPKGMER